MIEIPLIVRYRDGREQRVTGTQYGLAEYASHCLATGRPAPLIAVESDQLRLDSMEQLRYLAWAELERDGEIEPWPAWHRLVDSVVPSGPPREADPTRPAMSAG